MSIDDPLEAAKAVLANEDRSRSPVQHYAAKVIGQLPGALAKAMAKVLEDNAVEKLAYMSEVLKHELIRVRTHVERLWDESEEHRVFYTSAFPELILDGFRRAERTRAKDRINRIASILANGAVTAPPPKPDEIEEMMRIAMELSDREILPLRELLKHHPFSKISGPLYSRLIRGQGIRAWDEIPWRDLGFSEHELESACAKLQSFGLLALLNRPAHMDNSTFTVPINAYEVLDKGQRFVQFASQSVS